MKYLLVFQFEGALIEDFDALLNMEFELGLGLGEEHFVEGHEFSGENFNLMVRTDSPEEALRASKEVFRRRGGGMLCWIICLWLIRPTGRTLIS